MRLFFPLISLLIVSGVAAAQPSGRATSPELGTIPPLGMPGASGPQRATPELGVMPPQARAEIRRAPGVTSVEGPIRRHADGSPAWQYFVDTPLRVRLTRMGTPGEVRLRVESLPRPGQPRALCRFTTADGQQAGPAVIAEDGTATLQLTGVFQPLRPSGVTTGSICRLEVVVLRRQPNLAYREEARIPLPEIPVAAHETVTVTETARLRGFLRPVTSVDCEGADLEGRFGLRVTAGAVSKGCRTDFLYPRDPRPGMFGAPTMNELPHGVILQRMSWRIEGSQQACELCINPLAPCRGAGQIPAMLVDPLVPLNWVYAPLRPADMAAMPGQAFAVFGGPPLIARNEAVRVDTRTETYDTSLPDYLDRILGAGQNDLSGSDVIGQGDGRWRSWMRPFAVRLQCSAWAPPPADVARSAAGALRGAGLQAPSPPSLRLVLDSITFLRPAGTLVPGE